MGTGARSLLSVSVFSVKALSTGPGVHRKRGFYVTLHLCFPRIWYSAWHVEDGDVCLKD